MMTYAMIAEPGKQELFISYIFDAPQELVYKTYTNPETISQWWGPRSLTTTVDRMETRKGGVWRFVQHDGRGNEFAFNGVYHECAAPERLVYTFEFEGMPGQAGLIIVSFEELPGGRTKLTEQSIFPSLAARDGVIQSGMEAGAKELMDRLAELLAKLQA
ncbi:SRPBCC family protein [Paenibacillus silvisoli]|uniref:SRPBCC family protein n=1 Tax=Paenibacillus silvisoli TaxID=3110539 RepID=UPI00280506C1|nr:SRPBCC family protein [Paenibacillus silvisoli]